MGDEDAGVCDALVRLVSMRDPLVRGVGDAGGGREGEEGRGRGRERGRSGGEGCHIIGLRHGQCRSATSQQNHNPLPARSPTT